MYNVFSIADYANLHVWKLPYSFGGHGGVLNLLFSNSRSGSVIQFTTMAKGYEQVAMIKMVFSTEHFISTKQSCCNISVLEIMPAVSTGVAHAAAES